jgi:hypothetical protein
MPYPDPSHSEENFDSWLEKCPFDWDRGERNESDTYYDLLTIRFYVLREKD